MKYPARKHLIPALLVLVLCAGFLSLSASAQENEGPTKPEIRQAWQTVTSATSVFVTEPSIAAPYATGELTDSFLESGITYLNYIRFVAGLPEVQLDDTLNVDSQHGAVTLAALNELTHYPTQPEGMDDAFYDRAYDATTSANIGCNWGYDPLDCLQVTVASCMDDNSSYTNLSTVGHRRWLLNPTLQHVGFGYAQAADGWNYTVNHVHNRTGPGCDYDYIAWPVAGNHPTNLFSIENPWSVTLNPDIYQTPSADQVRITITRQSDGKTWTFDSATGEPSTHKSAYMVVDTQWYAIPNCIIFHPGSANVDAYEGVFTVDISGIFYADGTAAALHYAVDFFNVEASCTTHEYETDTTAATCTADGMVAYTCINCGDSYTEVIPATGHTFANGVCDNCGTPGGTVGELNWILEDGVLTISGTGAMPNFTYKSEMPWYGCAEQITDLVIESGVTSVGDYAFYGMPNLETVSIPDGVTYLGAYAFKNCTALVSAPLPQGLTKLGESAFYGCTSLASVEIPASLWTVQPYTFKNCTGLTNVTFHEGNLQKIADGAFYNTGLTQLVLPDCLDILDVYTFKNCADLASVTLGTGLTEIREAAFYATALTDLDVPEGIIRVGPYAFKNCTSLATVNLPDSLTAIGEAAFYGSTITALDIPDGVGTIGSYAFKNCVNLADLELPAGLTAISEACFYNCHSLETFVLPSAVVTIDDYAFRNCTALVAWECDGGDPQLKSVGTSAFQGCTSLVAFGSNQGFTTIGDYAFKNCTSLCMVTMYGTEETLGDSAFYGCTALESILICEGTQSIGEYCFARCAALADIHFLCDAPAIAATAFSRVTATAHYCSTNAGWTTDVLQNYGGTLTWVDEA